MLLFLFSSAGGRGDSDALTSRLCSTLSRSLRPDRSLRSLKTATSTVGRMAQERVSRTRVNRDHRSFRKPWSVWWALWWRGAGLEIPEEGLLSSLRPSHAWGNPLPFHF